MSTRGADEDTSIRHRASSIQAQTQISLRLLLLTFPHSWILVFCFFFFPLPSSPSPFYSLYCSCVVSTLFDFPFFPLFLFFPFFYPLTLDLSDASNASRVMQVWLSVSVDRQPALKRCKCPICSQRALWSASSISENKTSCKSKAKHGYADVLFSLVVCWWIHGWTEERIWREMSELRLDSEVGGVAPLLKTAPYLPTVSHAFCVVL